MALRRAALLSLLLLGSSADARVTHSSVHRSMVGRHLSIGLMSGSYLPYYATADGVVTWQELSAENGDIEGYVAGMVDAVMEELGATYTFVAMDFPTMMQTAPYLTTNGTFDAAGRVDLVLGAGVMMSYINNFFGWQLGTNIALTHTLYNSEVSGLVSKSRSSPSMWRFLEPFSYQLWLVLMASFSAVALILMGLQLLNNDEQLEDVEVLADDERAAKLRLAANTRWSFMRSLFHSHYHAFAAYLQGDDYEWVTGPERLLRLGLLFLVLISISSYTANLAAFFTKPSEVIHGPKTLSELKAATVCSNGFGDVYDIVDGVQVKLSGWEDTPIGPYVKTVISADMSECPGIMAYQCGMEWCHNQLVQGNADIWLEDALQLHEFQQNNDACDTLHLRREISILRSYYNLPLVLPLNSPLLGPLSEAIMFVERAPISLGLYSDYFKLDRMCSSVREAGDTTQIQLRDMEGLFLFCGVISALATAVAVFRRLQRRFTSMPTAHSASLP